MCFLCFGNPAFMAMEAAVFFGIGYLLGDYAAAGQVVLAGGLGIVSGLHLAKKYNNKHLEGDCCGKY